MLTVGYTDREILDLMEACHPMDYYAMYIVDTFGSMSGEQFRRYHALFENNLKPEAWLGYHSHNNLQLAYSNAITFLDLAHTRKILIDSSILGMGRGAGNLNSELLAGYMNDRLGAGYNIGPMLEVIDSTLEDIKREQTWGYSIAHFLSASLNCHPNYAGYLLRKKNLTVQDIKELLESIEPENRVRYDEELIARIHQKSREAIRREETLEQNLFGDVPVVMLASGPSAKKDPARLFSARKERGARIVALNHIPDFLDPDFVFITNQKRYDEFLDRLDPKKLIASTLLDLKATHAGCQLVDGHRLLKEAPGDSDNVALQFLGFAEHLKVKEVLVAGLDGYDPVATATYSYEERGGILDPEVMRERNQELEEGIRQAASKLSIGFLTPSRFQGVLPMRICGVIPARYESSRFEGKPLAKIAGVPMLKHTYDQARKCEGLEKLLVATDDERIREYCEAEGIGCVMTSKDCLTGTDRVAEVMRKTDFDFYINIQGDEPVIDPRTIEQVEQAYRTHLDDYIAYNLYKKVEPEEKPESPTVIKVIVNEKDELMYMSRHPVPFEKGSNKRGYLKQVCVYGFTRKALEVFAATGKAPVEMSEDIEILRFLEKGYKVGMVETTYDSIAVDVPEDISRVEKWLAEQNTSGIVDAD
jgi:3-deoxy-D-manno-octulosonate cytidylyltransferase